MPINGQISFLYIDCRNMDRNESRIQENLPVLKFGRFETSGNAFAGLNRSGVEQREPGFVFGMLRLGSMLAVILVMCFIMCGGRSVAFTLPNLGFIPTFANVTSGESESKTPNEMASAAKSAPVAPQTSNTARASEHERIDQMLTGGDLKSAAAAIEELKKSATTSQAEQVERDRLRLRFYDLAADAVLSVEGSVSPASSEIRVDGVKFASQFPIVIKGYGRHVLAFSCEGYEPFEKTIDVEAMSGKVSIGSVNLIRRYKLQNPEDEKPLGESEVSLQESKANQESMKLAMGPVVETWRSTWESGGLDAFGRLYSGAFTGTVFSTKSGWNKFGKDEWIKDRSGKIARYKKTSISLGDLQITSQKGNQIRVSFDQNYKSGGFVERGRKTIGFRKSDRGRYVIMSEDFMPARLPASNGSTAASNEPYQLFIEKWRQAFESKNMDDLTSLYGLGFTARNQTLGGVVVTKRQAWLREKAKEFSGEGAISVEIDDLVICDDSEFPGAKLVSFRQTCRAGGAAESGNKLLRIVSDRSGRMWIMMEFFQSDTPM